MSSISNINPGFLQSYVNFHSKTKLTIEEMFKHLSIEMGGDGKTITKSQLDDYIEKAESHSVKISKQKLSALKQIQKNWDTISKGEDSISAGNMEGCETLLAAAIADGFETIEVSDAANNAVSEIYKYLLENLGISDLKDASDSDLNSYLQTLLSEDSDDDAIGDAIDSLINLMAKRGIPSNVELEA